MAGFRAATLISPNPAWDQKLGDYYKDASEKNAVLSKDYYDRAKKDQAVVKETAKEGNANTMQEEHNSSKQ